MPLTTTHRADCSRAATARREYNFLLGFLLFLMLFCFGMMAFVVYKSLTLGTAVVEFDQAVVAAAGNQPPASAVDQILTERLGPSTVIMDQRTWGVTLGRDYKLQSSGWFFVVQTAEDSYEFSPRGGGWGTRCYQPSTIPGQPGSISWGSCD